MKEGFPKPVFWMLVALLLLASATMASWFWLVIRDVWIGDEQPVAGRFDMPAVLRIICVVLPCMAVPSSLLWTHHKRADSYG